MEPTIFIPYMKSTDMLGDRFVAILTVQHLSNETMYPGIKLRMTPSTRYSLYNILPSEFQNVHTLGEFRTTDKAICTFWACIYERKAP